MPWRIAAAITTIDHGRGRLSPRTTREQTHGCIRSDSFTKLSLSTGQAFSSVSVPATTAGIGGGVAEAASSSALGACSRVAAARIPPAFFPVDNDDGANADAEAARAATRGAQRFMLVQCDNIMWTSGWTDARGLNE